MKCAFCNTENSEGSDACVKCGMKTDASAGTTSHENIGQTADNTPHSDDSSGMVGSSIQKGRYTIIRKLGAGGMGKIYLAHDSKMEASVVIKEMSPVLNDEERKEYFHKQFETEAKLLYRLSYRGIPKVTDFFSDDDKNYLIMEFVEGQNFDNIIKERENHKISFREFIKWMDQLLATLAYLHKQEPPIIHRDIKPSNLMLNSEGDIILVDFGLAKSLDQQAITQTQVGTLGYASPEHYTGKFSVASDVYSLGASFHYMLTGDPPNTRAPFDFPPIASYRADIPEEAIKLVEKMLQRKKEKRYASIAEVRTDFDKLSKDFASLLVDAPDVKPFKNVKPQAGKSALTQPDLSLQEENSPFTNLIPDVTPSFAAYNEIPGFSAYPDPGRTRMIPEKSGNPWKAISVILVLAIVIFAGLFSSGILKNPMSSQVVNTPQKPGITQTQDKSPDKLVVEGIQLMYDGKYSDAINNFSDAIKKDPTNAAAFKNRGMIYIRFGDSKKALSDLNMLLSLQPEDLEVLAARAELNMQAGKYHESKKDIDKLLSLQPGNKENYYKRAFIFNKLGNPDLAAKDLDIILAIDPKEDRARSNLSRIYLKQSADKIEKKDYKASLAYCAKLLEIDPQNGKAFYIKGFAEYALGRKEAALVDFKKSLRLNPGNDDAALYISKIQSELAPPPPPPPPPGDPDNNKMPVVETPEMYPKARSGKPDNKSSIIPASPGMSENEEKMLAIADKKIKGGRPGDAVNIINDLLSQKPNSPEALYAKGVAFYRLKKYKEAYECFNSVANITPPGSEIGEMAIQYKTYIEQSKNRRIKH
jgi:serine/threonine protein kinase/TolA-binding protein